MDALDDNGFPDVEIFQEYFSDLSDDKLAVQLTDLVTSCVEPVRVNNNSSSKKKMGYVYLKYIHISTLSMIEGKRESLTLTSSFFFLF